MRKQMIEDAAYEVATQVRAVEDSIEAALIEIAELQTRGAASGVELDALLVRKGDLGRLIQALVLSED